MWLLEFEGKTLLARHGVPIPPGQVVDSPDLPRGIPLPAVLKAQVPAGKRGKAGAIRFADDWQSASRAVRDLLAAQVAGFAVKKVLVEQRLVIERELYVAFYLDRVAQSMTLLATPVGGMDVEEVEEARFIRVPIHPFVGVRAHHVRAVQRWLGVPDTAARDLDAVLRGMWAVCQEHGAILVEINPLALTADGRIVAADAKVVLDSRAAGIVSARGEDRSRLTTYEREASQRQAVGVEIGGDIAVVASGAGCLMATADSISARGGSLAGLLDLGGFPRDEEAEAELFALTRMLNPRVVVFNFYTQVMRCDQYAAAILRAFPPGSGVTVVARLKGHMAAEGTELLARAGYVATESYAEACDLAVRATGALGRDRVGDSR